jgi:hypothetical protein
MLLKKDTPNEVIKAIDALESRADSCFDDLELYSIPKGLASWAVLVSLVLKIEQERKNHGYKNYDAKLVNLSRRGALVIRWIHEKGKGDKADAQRYLWNERLSQAVDRSLSIAGNYDAFLSCFPLWHRDIFQGELLSESTIRFEMQGGAQARRVSAFHKGIKPFSRPSQNEGLDLTEKQIREMDAIVSQCFYSGDSKIVYPEPISLYQSLLPSYVDRTNSMFRRSDAIDLGPYTIEDLKRGYSALTTIFAAHEDICYRFSLRQEYPVNSCVMMRKQDEWARLVHSISGLDQNKSSAIIEDLTLRDRFWNLHVHPFIQVDEDMLAVAPQFPLHSRIDENILRICGHRRRSYFDEASLLKEQEMIDNLLPICPKQFTLDSHIPLPDGLPDIDFLLVDENFRTVLISELKWLRKPYGWLEKVERDEDFRKGLRQLSNIKSFLSQNSAFLLSRCKLKNRLDQYVVTYALIARDHFLWPDSNNVMVTDYEIIKESLLKGGNLMQIVEILRSYDWLPLENTHFEVRFDQAIANGVTIQSEVFYRIAPPEGRN